MTRLARRRETSGGVVRVSCALIILLMAAIAGDRQRGVVVVHMTLGAQDGGVEPRQRKCRVVVVE